MFSVIHITAPNDNNGNPRRCFAVYKHDGPRYSKLVAVVDEGYSGEAGLASQIRGFGGSDYCIHCRVNVSASEYKSWVKADPR